jgi:hypothetical protein
VDLPISCFYRLSSSFVTQMWVVHSRNTHDSYSPPSPRLAPQSQLILFSSLSQTPTLASREQGTRGLWEPHPLAIYE